MNFFQYNYDFRQAFRNKKTIFNLAVKHKNIFKKYKNLDYKKINNTL